MPTHHFIIVYLIFQLIIIKNDLRPIHFQINQRFNLGNATEHTFRGDLQQLIESLVPTIQATNKLKRQSCGTPDYILTKKDILVGFIEAKDIEGKNKPISPTTQFYFVIEPYEKRKDLV